MNPQQLAAIQQALSNFKAVLSGQFPTVLNGTLSLNFQNDGAYTIQFQLPSVIAGKANTISYSGPAGELPAAQ